MTGLRLANNPRDFLTAKIPSSGLVFAEGSSHFGPPTAPRIIASESLQDSNVLSGKAVPNWSIAQPPISSFFKSKSLFFLRKKIITLSLVN